MISQRELNDIAEHFVYIYRRKDGIPFYVGRGAKTGRSLSNTGPQAHNKELSEALHKIKDYFVEIAGPLSDIKTAALVEGALISALRSTPGLTLHNKASGPSTATFRPIGVPPEFSVRASEPPLTRADLRRISGGRPVLLVLVKDNPLRDGRIGVDLANPPTAPEIQQRMDRWWQLNSRMEKWRGRSSLISGVLVATSGTPRHRIVVGALAIDRKESPPWESEKEAHRECQFSQIHILISGNFGDDASPPA